MKSSAVLIPFFLLISILTGCVANDYAEREYLTLPEQDQSTGPMQSVPDSSGDDTSPSIEGSNTLSFEIIDGDHSGLKSGSLVFTITGARAVNNIYDVPKTDGFDGDTLVMYQNGEEKIFHYPDFLQDDGSFIDGAYLILVDVTVESYDAVSYTLEDEPSGMFNDPYLFDSRSLFNIVDVTDSERVTEGGLFGGEVRYRDFYITYYSRRNEFPEDRMTFRILPGEKIDFSIGCIIGNNEDGSVKDLSAVCVRVWDPEKGDIFIQLGLSN